MSRLSLIKFVNFDNISPRVCVCWQVEPHVLAVLLLISRNQAAMSAKSFVRS